MYKCMQEEGEPSETLPAEGIGCIPVTRGTGKVSVTVSRAIENTLMTSGVEGRFG